MVNTSFKCTISRKTTLLHDSLGKITQDQEISVVNRCEIPFVSLPFQKCQKRIFITGAGSFGNVGERSYPKRSTHTRVISQQPLPCRKKGWRESPSDKLKNIYKSIPYEHFKIENLHRLKFLLEQDDLLCKIDLKEAYFSVSLNKNNGQAIYTNFFAFVLDSGQLQEFLKNY